MSDGLIAELAKVSGQSDATAAAGMPDGEYRHLMCSKNVPDAVIQKLNAAIKFKK